MWSLVTRENQSGLCHLMCKKKKKNPFDFVEAIRDSHDTSQA